MISFRYAGALLGFAVSIGAVASPASDPTPALFAWNDIQVVLFPDTADGTLIVLSQWYRGPRPANAVNVSAWVDPDSAKAWIPRARAFLGTPAPGVDTSHVAVSLPLTSTGGERSFVFARRRTDDGWTRDRYLVIRDARAGRVQQSINLSRQAADLFLDSLTAVVLRTPLLPADRQHQPPASLDPADTAACPRLLPVPGNSLPRYPADERSRGMDGHVIAAFRVTERGTVDDKTAVIVFASRPAFARAVRQALPHFRFDPARENGAAVSTRVLMPFTFWLTRPNEDWGDLPQPRKRCD